METAKDFYRVIVVLVYIGHSRISVINNLLNKLNDLGYILTDSGQNIWRKHLLCVYMGGGEGGRRGEGGGGRGGKERRIGKRVTVCMVVLSPKTQISTVIHLH